jgi:hypothetical protein
MSDHQIKERWVTRESRARLSSLLGLVEDPFMQDWELECANPQRIEEFLDLYERGSLSDDDRFALMALIVASFDDWLSEAGADEAVLLRVRRNLSANFSLHEATIHHWCLWNEPNTGNVFRATPFMREIWRKHR